MRSQDRQLILDRAMEFAASGACRNVREIRQCLENEGFDDANRVLERAGVNEDLVLRCKVATLSKRAGLIGLEYELVDADDPVASLINELL